MPRNASKLFLLFLAREGSALHVQDNRLFHAGKINGKGLVERIRPFIVCEGYIYCPFFSGSNTCTCPGRAGSGAGGGYGQDGKWLGAYVGYRE